jgi:hypothetical protein
VRKPLFVALGALASFLVATATLVGTASAHATFSVSSVPADSQVTLYMDVPHERADGIHNVKVVVAMPSGWSAVGCQQKATWSCGIGSQSGRPVVQFTKDAGAGPAEDEGFVLTVRTGGVGTSSLPVLQTYSTGEEVGWIGAPGSPLPAPVLRTTAVAPPTTAPPATAPPVTAPPATNAPAVPGGGATTGGPTATTVAPGAAATSDATTADGDPATVDTGAEPTAGADVATTDGTTANEISDGELASAAGGGSDRSAGVVLAVVAALVVLGTAGGVVVVRARRRPGGDGPLS